LSLGRYPRHPPDRPGGRVARPNDSRRLDNLDSRLRRPWIGRTILLTRRQAGNRHDRRSTLRCCRHSLVSHRYDSWSPPIASTATWITNSEDYSSFTARTCRCL
jgi:hypothetical protein